MCNRESLIVLSWHPDLLPHTSCHPKDATETAAAFRKHFEAEVKRHGHVTCVSLVEQSGKEKVIADAYLNNILTLDSPSLTFVTFDFHEYWCVC